MAKKTRRRKHIPQRTCVGCREVGDKLGLMRVVRTPDGVFPDDTGKAPGRGAYLHANQECWQRGMKGALAKALRVELSEADRQRLQAFAQDLPEQRAASEAAQGED